MGCIHKGHYMYFCEHVSKQAYKTTNMQLVIGSCRRGNSEFRLRKKKGQDVLETQITKTFPLSSSFSGGAC